MAMTEIGEEACSFLCASARAFVVVISNVADYLQGVSKLWALTCVECESKKPPEK